jgi:hypothetical protein
MESQSSANRPGAVSEWEPIMPIGRVPPTDPSIREHGLEAVGSKVPGGSSLKPIGRLAHTVFLDGNLVPERER